MYAVCVQQAQIISLTRLYAGLFLYLLAEQCVHTGQTAYSLNNRTPKLALSNQCARNSLHFCHLHYSPHHLCTKNVWRLTDVDATSLGYFDAISALSVRWTKYIFTRNVYVYSLRVSHCKNCIITCANRQDKEQYAHLTSFYSSLTAQPGRVSHSVGHVTEEPEVPGSIAGLVTYFRGQWLFFYRSFSSSSDSRSPVSGNRSGALSLAGNRVVRLTDRHKMTVDLQQQQ